MWFLNINFEYKYCIDDKDGESKLKQQINAQSARIVVEARDDNSNLIVQKAFLMYLIMGQPY